MTSGDDLLVVKEVAAIFRVSDQTVRRWVREKKIPYLRVCGSIRFRRSDIEAFAVEVEPELETVISGESDG